MPVWTGFCFNPAVLSSIFFPPRSSIILLVVKMIFERQSFRIYYKYCRTVRGTSYLNASIKIAYGFFFVRYRNVVWISNKVGECADLLGLPFPIFHFWVRFVFVPRSRPSPRRTSGLNSLKKKWSEYVSLPVLRPDDYSIFMSILRSEYGIFIFFYNQLFFTSLTWNYWNMILNLHLFMNSRNIQTDEPALFLFRGEKKGKKICVKTFNFFLCIVLRKYLSNLVTFFFLNL